uniref:Uncharacterized protein n=1 Tax=Cacopsylla melanoneura TaxID=428564 RepID=A0A8D9BV38_9HEMI
MKFVLSNYLDKYPVHEYHCLTDSTVALCWAKGSPHLWNTFVGNRVSKIQENIDIEKIHHVKGSDNPADALSRGQLPSEFVKNELYFNGPTWLQNEFEQWPTTSYENLKGVVPPEQKAKVSLVGIQTQIANPLTDLFLKCSSWPKLLNIVVYFLRFIKKTTQK